MRNNPYIPHELYYLDDDFSIATLKKYQLKQILTTHKIPYLSSFTRTDLINLFKKNIESKREQILNQHEKEELEKQEEEDKKYGRGRRVVHKPIKLEQEFQELPVRSRRKSDVEQIHQKDADGFAIPSLPAKKVLKFNAEDSFASSDEEGYKPSPRKQKSKPAVKKSIVTTTKKPIFSPPSFNAEDSFASSDDEEYYGSEVELDVSSEYKNSKPIAPVIIQENVSIKNEEDEDDEDYHADGDSSDEEDEDIGEVDREELVGLYKDQEVPPEVFVSECRSSGVTTRAQRLVAAREKLLIWKARIKFVFYTFLTFYMVFGTIGLGITAYARQKNGYCQNYPKSVNITATSPFLPLLPPSCIPCPDHGTCTHGELVCDALYEQKTPIYNIYHIFPMADDCVHNSVLGKYVGEVERHIKNQLALRQGQVVCTHLLAHPDSNASVPIARVLVKDLLAGLKTNVQSYLPTDKMDEIMVIALSAVLEDPKVHYWEVGNQRFLGTDHVKYSLACKVKRLYNSIPFDIKMYILLFMAAVSAIYGITKDYRKKMLYKAKINNLVKLITDRLKQQYDNHIKDAINYPSPALPVAQLRPSIVDVNDRKTLIDWQCIVDEIEVHPHIKKSSHEVRGDPVEYWELTA